MARPVVGEPLQMRDRLDEGEPLLVEARAARRAQIDLRGRRRRCSAPSARAAVAASRRWSWCPRDLGGAAPRRSWMSRAVPGVARPPGPDRPPCPASRGSGPSGSRGGVRPAADVGRDLVEQHIAAEQPAAAVAERARCGRRHDRAGAARGSARPPASRRRRPRPRGASDAAGLDRRCPPRPGRRARPASAGMPWSRSGSARTAASSPSLPGRDGERAVEPPLHDLRGPGEVR